MEIKDKKNRGSAIVIVILILLLIGTGGYIVYDKYFLEKDVTASDNKQVNKTDDETEIIEVLEVTDSEIVNLYEVISVAPHYYCGVDVYYTDGKVSKSELSNDLVFDIVINQLYNDKKLLGLQAPYVRAGDTFNKEEVENKIKSIFGSDYQFTHRSYGKCPVFEYDQVNQKYVINQEPACGGTCGPNSNIKKIVKVLRTEDSIEMYIRVLFAGDTTSDDVSYYKDYKKTQLLTDLEKDYTGFVARSDSNCAKGSLYKLIFNKEDSNYVFESSELVTE